MVCFHSIYIIRKTKCSFKNFLPQRKNASDFSGAFPFFLVGNLYIQVELHILFTIKQLFCPLYIIFVDVGVTEVQRD